MTVFFLIGGVGIALLLLALFVGDVLDGALGFDGIDSLGALGSDLFSTAGIAGLLGGFGFGGALGLALTDSMVVALVVGITVGVLLGLGAGKLTQILRRQGGGAAPRTDSLIGLEVQVVTAIPAGGYGQVRLTTSGHTHTLNAKSAVELDGGSRAWVAAVLTPTSVEVRPVDPSRESGLADAPKELE